MSELRKYNIHPEKEKFRKLIEELIITHQIEQIIETGSFDGLGSTKIFAETGLSVKSLECNYAHYLTAKQNLSEYPNAEIINGFSLNKQLMIDFIKNDGFLDDEEYYKQNNILSDNKNNKKFYTWELKNNSEKTLDDILLKLIDNDKNQLIFLDSAGGVGYLEFKEVFKIKKQYVKNKLILLDDVFHIKHHRSHKFLIENNIPFEIFDNRMLYFKLW